MKPITRTLVAIALVAWLLQTRPGDPCGPFFPQAIFVRPHGPDRPMSAFSQGRIGIVLPTWYRAYLVVAYRYLESKPLTPQEQKSLLERWDVDHPLPPPDTTQRAIALWMSARKHYLPSAPPKDIQEFKPNTAYYFEANCLAPAFITAAATLENRARRVGPASEGMGARAGCGV
jgi:hypothetical protein